MTDKIESIKAAPAPKPEAKKPVARKAAAKKPAAKKDGKMSGLDAAAKVHHVFVGPGTKGLADPFRTTVGLRKRHAGHGRHPDSRLHTFRR